MTYITRKEWALRFKARIIDRAQLPPSMWGVADVECAAIMEDVNRDGTPAWQTENPEDSADEAMSYWTD